MADPIENAYQLVKQRANDRGVSSNISPAKFNIIWPRAELKFFNNAFRLYAETQTISDSISKWMSDPLYLPVSSTGRYDFFTGMNLLHVDTLNGYKLATTTIGSIGSISNLTAGSGYTNGDYEIALTGGTGSGARANLTVSGGVVTVINYLVSIGTGYTINDTLTGTIPGGTGFSIKVASIVDPKPYDVTRVEKSKVAANLTSEYDAPDREFPIYTQFSSWFQFYPSIGIAQLIYLKQPAASFWNYTLNGNVDSLTGLVGGSSYTNGTYVNVPLTGGSGSGILATVIVSGGAVNSVTINPANRGKLYRIGNVLSALNTSIGGTGTGFSVTVANIVNARPVYNPTGSVQPKWNDNDISLIVDYALEDTAINARDSELQQFAQIQTQSKLAQ